jgi:hypothetical protein
MEKVNVVVQLSLTFVRMPVAGDQYFCLFVTLVQSKN